MSATKQELISHVWQERNNYLREYETLFLGRAKALLEMVQHQVKKGRYTPEEVGFSSAREFNAFLRSVIKMQEKFDEWKKPERGP